MTDLRWRPAPGWPPPAPGWSPPDGWQPDPSWPPAPANWSWWEPLPSRQGVPLIVAGVSLSLLAFVVLVLGLVLPSLALVYLSILCSVLWLPLVVVGVVRLCLSASRRRALTPG